jgi:hypothetical protein
MSRKISEKKNQEINTSRLSVDARRKIRVMLIVSIVY